MFTLAILVGPFAVVVFAILANAPVPTLRRKVRAF
jgi:hypothetical protein